MLRRRRRQSRPRLPPVSTHRKLALVCLGLAVSAVFAYLAVRGVNWAELRDGLRQSNYWWVIPAILLLFAAQGMRALRWQYLFPRPTRPAYGPTLEATLLGQAVNNVLPARAGEAARVVALNRTSGTSIVEASATVPGRAALRRALPARAAVRA